MARDGSCGSGSTRRHGLPETVVLIFDSSNELVIHAMKIRPLYESLLGGRPQRNAIGRLSDEDPGTIPGYRHIAGVTSCRPQRHRITSLPNRGPRVAAEAAQRRQPRPVWGPVGGGEQFSRLGATPPPTRGVPTPSGTSSHPAPHDRPLEQDRLVAAHATLATHRNGTTRADHAPATAGERPQLREPRSRRRSAGPGCLEAPRRLRHRDRGRTAPCRSSSPPKGRPASRAAPPPRRPDRVQQSPTRHHDRPAPPKSAEHRGHRWPARVQARSPALRAVRGPYRCGGASRSGTTEPADPHSYRTPIMRYVDHPQIPARARPAAAAAESCCSGSRCEYRSIVVVIDSCPNRRCTTNRSVP